MLNFVDAMQQNLILFISGAGSNARQIIAYFKENEQVNVVGVLSSKANPEMAEFCVLHGLYFEHIQGNDFNNYLQICKDLRAHWVILAGFLKKIPSDLLAVYPKHIINIHPALLPNYGGAGMYGRFVHEAVHAAKEPFSGITIHLVNEEFDKGQILYQHAVALSKEETPESIEFKVRQLELQHFAPDIECYVSK